MIVNVKNENFGYSVATHDDWVVVGNPALLKYNPDSSSFIRTGSVDIFKYNNQTDQHDLLMTIYKPLFGGEEFVLSEDPSSKFIHTDAYKTALIPYFYSYNNRYYLYWYRWVGQDIPIQIDALENISQLEDDYGHSVDVYNDILAVGCRWYNQLCSIPAKEAHYTGSSVDIYNLSLLKSSEYEGFISTGSGFFSIAIPSPEGDDITGSFGTSVSLNGEWLAVGSPNWDNKTGGVHMYRRYIPNDLTSFSWSFFCTITGSDAGIYDYFGYSIDINKATGSYSGSLVVGCGNKIYAGSKVYYFEFDGVHWKEKFKFSADRTLYELPFYDVNPIPRCEDYSVDGFGNSVCLYQDTLGIGSPTDRWVYEYSGSRAYKQGAVYLFQKCQNPDRGWRLVKKFYGNEKTLKNNTMGLSLDVWGDKFVIGCPKSNAETMTSCYIQGSIFQQHYCYSDLENYIQGQWILLQKNTASVDSDVNWDVVNVYQKKKRFMTPYRSYGFDVAIGNKSIVIGSPMIIYDTNRSFELDYTKSYCGTYVTELDDITGKSYIYNLRNLREDFNVGNVFYRNGKIILNTSGSIFEGLWFNPINEYNYEYEVHFDSKQTLHEKQMVCTVEPGEFNVSTNPTSVVKEKAVFDINDNGWFDWQDMDIILKYMMYQSTLFSQTGPTTEWSSSIISSEDENSYYNYYSTLNAYSNTGNDFISQSFYKVLDRIGNTELDFNQDSKIDSNDLNIFWKYCSNRLTQINYQSYITPNSKRKYFSDILSFLDLKTQKNVSSFIKSDFLTFTSQSMADKTGSYLAPYVTSIGLYNGLDLVAIAKLGQPIKLTGEFPVNFVVKLDF